MNHNFRNLILLGALLFSNPYSTSAAEAKNVGPTSGNVSVKKPVKQGVRFQKVQIPSVDKVLVEVEKLDKDIVAIRETLYTARKSVHSLINGNRPQFKKELQQLVKSGAISITQKNGIPSLKFNKKNKRGRDFQIFQNISNLEHSIHFARKKVPSLTKTLKRLHPKSKKAIALAPSQLKKSVQSGKISLFELDKYVKRVNNNALKLKKVPVHLDQVKTQISKNVQLIKSLFEPKKKKSR